MKSILPSLARILPLLALSLLLPDQGLADEARLRNGTVLQGQLISLVFQTEDGAVHNLQSQDLSVFIPAAAPAPVPAPPAPAFGHRSGEVIRVPVPVQVPVPSGESLLPALPPGQPALDLELLYQAPAPDPETTPIKDYFGDRAEIFAFRPEQEKNRATWVRLGDAVRVENLTLAHFTPEEECSLLQDRIRDPELTREEILEELEANRTFTRTMRYVFRSPVALEDGPWVIYVNFAKIRRHRIWRGVRFSPEAPLQLRYSWSSTWSFGR